MRGVLRTDFAGLPGNCLIREVVWGARERSKVLKFPWTLTEKAAG
jgi:hypothetical protein